MNPIEHLAEAVLARDALLARSIVQDILRSHVDLSAYPAPAPEVSPRVRTMSAALLELLAERAGVQAPSWTAESGSFSEPFYVTALALRSHKQREMCDAESPEPLARRNIRAPGAFLTAV